MYEIMVTSVGEDYPRLKVTPVHTCKTLYQIGTKDGFLHRLISHVV